MDQCNGRYAFQTRPAECGEKQTHPAHRFYRGVYSAPMSPFVRRAMARELPAKEIAR